MYMYSFDDYLQCKLYYASKLQRIRKHIGFGLWVIALCKFGTLNLSVSYLEKQMMGKLPDVL